MPDTSAYKSTLKDIHSYLTSFEDRYWAPVLARWIAELETDLSPSELHQHVQRTLNATGGMGSLGDLSIAPINGHRIAGDRDEISRASEKLWQMVARLYLVAKSLVG